MTGSQDPRPSVGLIGLGNMGSAFAERLLDAGYDLVVHNRTPEKAQPLADDEALESVAAEVVDAARPGAVLVDASTVSPDASEGVAALAEQASLLYVRAPVSGNPGVVRAGNAAFIVSGPPVALDRVEPVLRAIGPTIHVVGDAEEARVVKLAINLVIAGLAQLMAEALVLGEAWGVSRAALLDTMGSSAAGAPFVKYKTEPLLRDDYSATFTTNLVAKDIDLVLDAAEVEGVRLPLAEDLKALVRSAIEAGYGNADFMALFLHLRSAFDQEVQR